MKENEKAFCQTRKIPDVPDGDKSSRTKLYKQKARDLGADLVGIVSGERFSVLAEKIPQIPATAKSAIVIGRRIMRGSLRGVEEGTNFKSTYWFFGCLWVEQQFLPRTVFEMVRFLESEGMGSVPASSEDIDVNVIAEAAGLGKIGLGDFFLTQEYGHRQRLSVIFTDAELESDSEYNFDFCSGCRACLDACPLGAVTENADGAFNVNLKICADCKNGAIPKVGSRTYLVAAKTQAAGSEEEGYTDRIAAACGRACMVALEGRLIKPFQNKFRKRSVWWVDNDGEVHVGKEEK